MEAPEGIIPKERIIAVVSWDIERQIEEALKEDPDPGMGLGAGLCQRTSRITGIHHNTHHSGQVLHFVPLTKLPSAMETTPLLIENVLRLHGIPAEITSDRGPQFISGAWQAFCQVIGAKTCLQGIIHRQMDRGGDGEGKSTSGVRIEVCNGIRGKEME